MTARAFFEAGARRPAPALRFRRARFEDVPAALRLCERAIEVGCRGHYDQGQRRAVFLGYATSMFVDVLAPFHTLVAELGDVPGGRLLGIAQLDPSDGRLRALFVDGDRQGHGHGAALLAAIERVARACGLRRLHGAMSLNAVPFYARAGFSPSGQVTPLGGRQPLVPILPMEKALAPVVAPRAPGSPLLL
jgi:putative acetyltransferase